MLMTVNWKRNQMSIYSRPDKTTNSCDIKVWWGRDCIVVSSGLLFSVESHTGKDTSYMLAPALPNPAWVNTCTYCMSSGAG